MNAQSTQEQFEFISEVIADRTQQQQPTYFTIKVERFGGLTPIVERGEGEKKFIAYVFKCISQYQPSAIMVELYSGKSHKVKEPFKTFKINIKNPANDALNGPSETPIEVKEAESIVPLERHYDMKFDLQVRLMQAEFEKQRLSDRVLQLETEVKAKEAEIEELENELENEAKGEKNSLGNISLGLAGANAIELFAKSQFGIGLLKNVFGANEETLKGLLGTASTQDTGGGEKSTASLVENKEAPKNENERIRREIINLLTAHFKQSDDAALRLYYELIQLIGGNIKALQQVYLYAQQFKQQAPPANKGSGETPPQEQDNKDPDDSS